MGNYSSKSWVLQYTNCKEKKGLKEGTIDRKMSNTKTIVSRNAHL